MSYREWLPKIAPTWLQERWGAAYLAEVGGQLDDQRQLLTYATRARFPGVAPADALPHIGKDRTLEQGPGESDVAYAARLIDAWDIFERAGSRRRLLLQLKLMGLTAAPYPTYLIQRNGRRSSLDAFDALVMVPPGTDGQGSGSHAHNFDFRGPEWWNQFGIIYDGPMPGLTYSGGVFSAQAVLLNRIVRRWKQGRAMYMGAVILDGSNVWGWPLSHTWGGGSVWGGSIGAPRFIPPR